MREEEVLLLGVLSDFTYGTAPVLYISLPKKSKLPWEFRVMQALGAKFMFMIHKFKTGYTQSNSANKFSHADCQNVQKVLANWLFSHLKQYTARAIGETAF